MEMRYTGIHISAAERQSCTVTILNLLSHQRYHQQKVLIWHCYCAIFAANFPRFSPLWASN